MNRNFVALVALTAICSLSGLPGYAQDQPPLPATAGIGADDLYNAGVDLQAAKKYNEAIARYTEAATKRKTFSDAYLNRGICYTETGEYEKALADFEFYIRRKPDLSEGYVSRAELFRRQKEYEKALAELRFAASKIRAPSESLAVSYVRGNVYLDMGEYEKAIHEYTRYLSEARALKYRIEPRVYQSRGNARMMRYRALEQIGATAESQIVYDAAQRDFAEYAKTNPSTTSNV